MNYQPFVVKSTIYYLAFFKNSFSNMKEQRRAKYNVIYSIESVH